MTDHHQALPAGHRLNEYRIERVIGSGGFGITYYARDTHLNKVVAIKEYLPNGFAVRVDSTTVKPKSTADQKDYQWGLARFLDEARTLARFEHPHLNQVHRFFKDNGTAYLVLEHIEGETLSRLLEREGRLESTRLKRLLKELLSGLDEVHRASFVHRDVKPSNIMFRKDGSSVLLDFGTARQVLGQRSKSTTAVFTPCYAPIEEHDRKGDDIGPWTDLYALGIVAYRCVSGISEAELLGAVTRARLERKGEQDKDMKPAVELGKGRYDLSLLKAIDWAIKVDENDRPQSVAAINEMIAGREVPDAVTDSAPVDKPTSQPSSSKSDGNQTRQWRWGWIWAGVIGLVLAGVIIGQIDKAGRERITEAAAQKCLSHFDKEEYTKALEWCRKAAEQGDALGQIYLGLMYRNGYGVARNYTEAVKWYRKSAEQGDAYGQTSLGVMYQNGYGVLQDYLQALKWYHKAAEQGYANAQNNLGLMYFAGYEDWVKTGSGVRWCVSPFCPKRKPVETAVRWYRRAAEQGHAGGQYNLGYMYQNGYGVPQDYAEAVKWYHKAAAQGDALGQSNLGWMYSYGYGVAQDYAEAVKWYRRAAEQGNARGQSALGNMYYYGKGVDRNYAEAVKWYRKAAEQGNANGQTLLGWMYQNGHGVSRDKAEAVKWYRKAAEQGNASGQTNLGGMYHYGYGVVQDYVQAVRWYHKAAEQGHAAGQYNLGYMYQNGHGVDQNTAEAVRWFRKAANQGYTGAKEALENL